MQFLNQTKRLQRVRKKAYAYRIFRWFFAPNLLMVPWDRMPSPFWQIIESKMLWCWIDVPIQPLCSPMGTHDDSCAWNVSSHNYWTSFMYERWSEIDTYHPSPIAAIDTAIFSTGLIFLSYGRVPHLHTETRRENDWFDIVKP